MGAGDVSMPIKQQHKSYGQAVRESSMYDVSQTSITNSSYITFIVSHHILNFP